MATRTLANKNGRIPVGTEVSFSVRESHKWEGALTGTLIFSKGKFQIETENNGILTIGDDGDVIKNTIKAI